MQTRILSILAVVAWAMGPGTAAAERSTDAGSQTAEAGDAAASDLAAEARQLGMEVVEVPARKKRRVPADEGTYELVSVPPEGQQPTDPEEQFQLGLALQLGRDTEGRPHKKRADLAEAAVWMRKAAEQGHARAQANLGTSYARGKGVERDYDESLLWLDRAAAQGSGKAMLELGLLYRDGQGVPKDAVRSLAWLMLAGQQGSAVGSLMISGVARGLTPEERVEALEWARKWRADNGFPSLKRAAGAGGGTDEADDATASRAAPEEQTAEPGPPS